MRAGAYPVVVTRQIEAALGRLVLALLKVRTRGVDVTGEALALARAPFVAKADLLKRPRRAHAYPAEDRCEEVVGAVDQLVDRPLRPVDDQRVELIQDQPERIARLAAHCGRGGDAAPLGLECADELAHTPRKAVVSKADGDEANNREEILVNPKVCVGDRGDDVAATVLVASV